MRTIHKAFRYRVYPTATQVTRLVAWEHALRFLWNLAHEQRLLGLARPRGERRYYTAFDQQKELTTLRTALPWLADVPRNVSAQLLVELDKAWQRCFKRLALQPRWKCRGNSSVALCESHPKVWKFDGTRVRFPKLGWLKTVVHRPLEGTGKTCSVVRDGDQWFINITCKLTVPDPTQPIGKPIALDRGVVNLVADSNGKITRNPAYFKQSQRRLARAQRVVAGRKKGSENQEKAKRRVMRIHRTIRRQREWYLHQITNHYAKSHGTVIVEKLQVRNMTRSAKGTRKRPGRNVRQKAGLNRSILDAGWGRLVEMLRYKCDWAGSTLLEVPAAYSSQTCSCCGLVDKDNRRAQATFVCVSCGHRDHADTNAAFVLLSRGIHGGAVCGGSAEVGRPVKQKLRAVRHGTRLLLS